MASYVDNLVATRDNYAAELASESAAPRPSYSLNGESVDFTAYATWLRDQIRELNTDIAMGSLNYEVVSQGTTKS